MATTAPTRHVQRLAIGAALLTLEAIARQCWGEIGLVGKTRREQQPERSFGQRWRTDLAVELSRVLGGIEAAVLGLGWVGYH